MIDDRSRRPGRVLTFYSYKGGVGRTLTLANCAALCASWGYRVLCVDWDLEAPGLVPYFKRLGARPGRGVVDLVSDSGLAWSDCVQALDHGADDGQLHFLPAGDDTDDAYGSQLATLDWGRLYDEQALGDRIEAWRAEWIERYDLVFLDSRTGLTDAGGICTAQLPDIVVFLFAPNEQGLEGAMRAVEKARAIRQDLPLDRAPAIEIPVPTRFEEDALGPMRRQWSERFLQHLTKFYDQWRERSAEPARLLEILRIPYKGEWAFGEPLPVREESLTDSGTISYRFAALAALLARDCEGSNELVSETARFIESAKRSRNAARGVDVFLSYSRAHSGTARELVKSLSRRRGPTGANLRVFLDEDGVRPGDDWVQALQRSVQDARHMVALVDAEPSPWQRTEISSFLFVLDQDRGGDRRLLPVWLDDEVTDPSLRRYQGIRRSQWSTAEELADRIVEALELAPAQPERSSATSAPRDLLADYRQAVAEAHRNLIPFFPGATDRLLEEVYVELELSDLHHTSDGEQDEEQDEEQIEKESGGRKALRGTATGPRSGARLRDFLLVETPAGSTAPRLAVIGEPGSGKSTVARHLAHVLADGEDRLPIFLGLAALDPEDFDPFECAAWQHGHKRTRDELKDMLQSEAARGNVVLLLDGLDEVEPRKINPILERIEKLANAHPSMAMAVMSRPIALQGREIGRTFARLRVEPLDDARRSSLMRKFLGERDAARAEAALLGHPGLRELVRNPLMLTLASLVVRENLLGEAEVPASRAELYESAIELLLRRGHCVEPRGVRDRGVAREILRELSLMLQQEGREAWSLAELSERLWKIRKDAEELNFRIKETWETNERFLEDIGWNAGVLGPHDGPHGPWRYLHRSLREYLTAEALKARDPADLESRMAAWAEELTAARQRGRKEEQGPDPERWGEVYALLAGLVDYPMSILEALRNVSPELAVRALRTTEAVTPRVGFEFLWSIPSDESDREPTWDGEEIVQVLRRPGPAAEHAADQLWSLVTSDLSVRRLGWLHWSLAELGVRDDERFFGACWRARPATECMEFVTVPAGRFLMGSPEDEAERTEAEGPQHEVVVSGFELARYAVTNRLYGQFDPSHDPETFGGKIPAEELAHHPVVNVSWWEAWLYCAWIGARLPSEGEWEYACRAGTTSPFSFEGELTPELVNYDGNYPYADSQKGEYRERTVRVGELPPNAWGLHEMHGNVWEWCSDRWHSDYEGAPVDGAAWTAGEVRARVLRGGSWHFYGRGCRSASRSAILPGHAFRYCGFRPARSSD